MTAIAGDEMPEEWNMRDQLHLEVYARITEIFRLGEHNALIFFTQEFMTDVVTSKIHADTDDLIKLDNMIDACIEADIILKRYLGPNYIDDYLDTLEEDDD